MSSAAMKWAQNEVRIAHPGLTHLVNTLAKAADDKGASWKSHATLAEIMGGSRHTVRKWLSALEKLGIIQRAHRSNGRGGRSSDIIRLRLDRPFTVSKDAVRAIFQAARGAGSKESSKRQKTQFQAARGANDKGSDQQKAEVANHETHPQGSQSALVAPAGEKPTLRVVNGGRP